MVSATSAMEPQPPKKPTMKVSWDTMKENHVPLHLRDYCAHVVIPLNRYGKYFRLIPI